MDEQSKDERRRTTIREEDIQAKDIERRPFLKRVALTGSLGVAALCAGCGSSFRHDISCDADSDPFDPVMCDND